MLEYEPFDLVMEAIDKSGCGENVMLSLDVAASHLYNVETGLYTWNGAQVSSHELIDWYSNLLSR